MVAEGALGLAVPPPDPAAAAAAAAAAAVAAASSPDDPPLIVPPSDKRLYKRLTLPNGMTVLLISDPAMADAAAAGVVDEEEGGRAGANGERRGRATPPSSSDEGGSDGDDDGSDSGSASGSSTGSEDGPPEGDDGSDDGGGPPHPPRAPTKKAAAAMAVAAGSLADPPSLPGLAHYLEHMLFMGSTKYPDENGYDAYLNRHGGSSNAWTDYEDTVYYFDCRPGALAGALDRFAQFFVSPLMKADALGREVGAVDNEFAGVLQSDGCRLAQLRAHTAAAGHPFARFAWGNRASLAERPAAAGVDVRAAMLDFYGRQYGAERMTLVVLGGQGLPDLARLVGSAFGPVPAGVGPPADHGAAGPPYGGGTLHISPAVKEGHTLTLAWCLPPLAARYRSKAEDYLAHLLGHEGRGSLLAALKSRGWATGLSAGVGEGGSERSSACFVFEVAVALTDAGLAAAPGAGLAPARLVFEAVGLLARAGPQAWVHDEVASIASARFRFAEEEDAAEYVSRLAPEARRYAPAHALAGPYLHDEWDPALVASLTAALTPGAARLDLQTSAAAGVLPPPPAGGGRGRGDGGGGGAPPAPPPAPPPGRLDEWVASPGAVRGVEPWFGLPYAAVPLPADLLEAWAAAAAGEAGGGGADEAAGGPTTGGGAALALPSPNPYIPTDFSLRCEDGGGGGGGGGDGGPATARSPPATPPGAAAAKRPRASDDSGDGAMAEDGAPPPALTPLCPPPTLLLDEPGLRVWHKLDGAFKVPRAVVRASISPAAADASPAAAAALHAGLRLWEDALCEEAYLAEVAGLGWAAWPEGRAGLEVRLDGFSHRLPTLARALFAGLAALPATIASRPDAFTRVIEALARKYRNANMKPDRHATFLRLGALKRVWAPDAVAAELEALTPSSLAAALPPLLADVHVEMLVQGNLTAGEAAGLGRDAWDALGGGGTGGGGGAHGPPPPPPPPAIVSRRLAASDRPADAVVRLPHGCAYLHRAPAKNPAEPNSVAEVYLQVGPDEPRARALLDLVAAPAAEAAYNTLRTVEQLGYAVHAGARCTHGVLGYAVVVVSGHHGPAHLDARIEAFLATFASTLASMPRPEFEAHRSALASAKSAADKALAEEADRHWEAVGTRRYDFLSREAELAALAGLTQADAAAFWEAAIAPGGRRGTRRRLAVHVCGSGALGEVDAPPPPGTTLVSDLGEMKAGLEVHPPPKPAMPRPSGV